MRHHSTPRILAAALALTIVTMSAPLGATGGLPQAQATIGEDDWWDADFEHRRQVTIEDTSNTTLEDYPILAGPFSIGDASTDSVRVVDESTGDVLDAAVRETDATIEVAFKVDVPANGTVDDVAIYDDNPDAEDVSIPWDETRYNFHDGFDDGVIDPVWNITRGDWREADGTLQPTSSEAAEIHATLEDPLNQTQTPIQWETRLVSLSNGLSWDQRKAWLKDDDRDANRLVFLRTLPNSDDGFGVNIGWNSADHRKLLTAGEVAVDQWINEAATLQTDGRIDASAVNEATGDSGERVYDATALTYTKVVLHDHGDNPNQAGPAAHWDHVTLRYKTTPEPTVTVGDEEDRPLHVCVQATLEDAMADPGALADLVGCLDA